MLEDFTALAGTPEFEKFSKGKGAGRDVNGRRIVSPSSITMTVWTLTHQNGKDFVASRTYCANA